MSTFKGYVSEFPDIRVDYFRRIQGLSPPLAYFLSHVHSDHLVGLENFDGAFIYCSAATKEILLRLEKSSVRLNYAQGIIENPRLQTYKHLEKKLKPIPLDTPTTISLSPGSSIRVTLIDANHCVGSVMFLFEGDGAAVLYTGDVRCEPRHITAITQNPNLVEYTSGCKTLDRIYLDTSILDNFPLRTKADGLRELLQKVQEYPKDTIFHFQAWTYGYEEVWIALSKALDSKIHVDEYKMRVFESLVTKPTDNRWAAQTHLAKEAPALVGFTCGNHPHEGCLTRDENVRIHSCEKGMPCSVMEGHKKVVSIRPIVTHLGGGKEMREVGIGGGGEDLARTTTISPELILDTIGPMVVDHPLRVALAPYMDMIENAAVHGRDISLVADCEGQPGGQEFIDLMEALASKLEAMRNPIKQGPDEMTVDASLPDIIHFPYARHSSLPELRELVAAFAPRDVVPCTFDADLWAQKGWSIQKLFGDCCYAGVKGRKDSLHMIDTTPYESTTSYEFATPYNSPESSPASDRTVRLSDATVEGRENTGQDDAQHEGSSTASGSEGDKSRERGRDPFREGASSQDVPNLLGNSQSSDISEGTYNDRMRAFDAAAGNMNGESWEVIGLISTTDHHTVPDEELGQPRSRD